MPSTLYIHSSIKSFLPPSPSTHFVHPLLLLFPLPPHVSAYLSLLVAVYVQLNRRSCLTVPPPLPRLVQNYDLLRRRFHQQRDHQDNMQQKLRRIEMIKNKIELELNSLKPEIKQLQAEKANKLRFAYTAYICMWPQLHPCNCRLNCASNLCCLHIILFCA